MLLSVSMTSRYLQGCKVLRSFRHSFTGSVSGAGSNIAAAPVCTMPAQHLPCLLVIPPLPLLLPQPCQASTVMSSMPLLAHMSHVLCCHLHLMPLASAVIRSCTMRCFSAISASLLLLFWCSSACKLLFWVVYASLKTAT